MIWPNPNKSLRDYTGQANPSSIRLRRNYPEGQQVAYGAGEARKLGE